MIPKLRILIVEDEALIALELESMLHEQGHEVVDWASDSRRALQSAERLKPDLVMVDLRLNDGLTGLDVVRNVGAMGLPALIVSSEPRDNLPDLGGALGFVGKPFDRGSIFEAIASVVTRAAGGRSDVSIGDDNTLSDSPPTVPDIIPSARRGG